MNKHRNHSLGVLQLCAILLGAVLSAAIAQAQTPETATATDKSSAIRRQAKFRFFAPATPDEGARRTGFAVRPASANINRLGFVAKNAPPAAVHGSGQLGRIPLWVDVNPAGNAILGDSIITQANGNLGVGLTTPASKLAVAGQIETTLGGYKFPDGTVQTTAAVSGLQAIVHDATLQGNGTNSAPLGIAVPLTLNGPQGGNQPLPGSAALGLQALGGNAPVGSGGDGLQAVGGNGLNGGDGVVAKGGKGSDLLGGGDGVNATGGDSTNIGSGGPGVRAVGGLGIGAGRNGGAGIIATGGPGQNSAIIGLAGDFVGNVEVSGNLSKGGGSFKIDHPLDPANKYLYHSFVESPDMKNIYDGTVTTDAKGEAQVTLPAYFDALNRDFRYQLTVIGVFAQAIVGQEIKGNCFTIKTSAPHVKVSWQVTGIRQDAYANQHRIQVETDKTDLERGYFLHPEAFNQPEARGVGWARQPALMRQIKEAQTKQLEGLITRKPNQ
jgi:hypothetical protein